MTNSWQKEWNSLSKKEKAYLSKGAEKKASAFNKMLEEKVPQKLQGTLNLAFAKAFGLVFEKGTEIIEKTYRREDTERLFKVNSYALRLREDKKGLRQFSKQAGKAGQKNLLLAGIEGIGLGTLGIALPDIPLFVGMLLKSAYETALHYGYGYEAAEEKYFILRLIQTALSYGEELAEGDTAVNGFIKNAQLPQGYSLKAQVERAAAALSGELLYMKFLQGIPVLGAVGGLCDVFCLQKVQRYARLKYTKRCLYDRKWRR